MSGRAARVFSLDEVAEMLSVEARWLRNAMEKAAPVFFPGARQDPKDQSVWRIPERDLRAFLGPQERLWRLYTVSDFAQLISVNQDTLRTWLSCGVVPKWDPKQPGKPGWRKIAGHIRISAGVYWTLPAEMPACVPARPSFFSRVNRKSEEQGRTEE